MFSLSNAKTFPFFSLFLASHLSRVRCKNKDDYDEFIYRERHWRLEWTIMRSFHFTRRKKKRKFTLMSIWEEEEKFLLLFLIFILFYSPPPIWWFIIIFFYHELCVCVMQVLELIKKLLGYRIQDTLVELRFLQQSHLGRCNIFIRAHDDNLPSHSSWWKEKKRKLKNEINLLPDPT